MARADLDFDRAHISGAKSHASIATFVILLLAMALKIAIVNVGSFGQVSLFLPYWARWGTPYLHGARDLGMKEGEFLYI